MSRRYEEQVEVRTGQAAEHGVRVEGALLTARGSGGQATQATHTQATQDTQGGVEVPTVFLWRGRVHLVRAVLAQWSQRVPWWRLAQGDQEHQTLGPQEQRQTLERQVWRVEASAGRSMGSGVYDLVQDDRWWLARVSD